MFMDMCKNQTDLSSLLNNKFNGGFLNLGHVSNQQSQYYLQIKNSITKSSKKYFN